MYHQEGVYEGLPATEVVVARQTSVWRKSAIHPDCVYFRYLSIQTLSLLFFWHAFTLLIHNLGYSNIMFPLISSLEVMYPNRGSGLSLVGWVYYLPLTVAW